MGNEILHDKLVTSLLQNPYKYLDFVEDDILCKSTEFEMYRDGRLYVVPDLFIQTKYGHHFFEVKSANNPNRKQKAEKQMERVDDWLQEFMPEQYPTSTIEALIFQ